ncbi:hypothetical protein AB6A40_005497 [Gnathostoma spinigerum]|uniref:Uncharacterized protein n=1 Tax=Gnathostoma spinigerum TaxID=75299 RepID=A0ABD6EFM3_9BILA
MKLFLSFLLLSMVSVSAAWFYQPRSHFINGAGYQASFEAPFRTVLCADQFPIRIQRFADAEEICRIYLKKFVYQTD